MLCAFIICAPILIMLVASDAQEFYLDVGSEFDVNPWQYGYVYQNHYKGLSATVPQRRLVYNSPPASQPPPQQQPTPTAQTSLLCYQQPSTPNQQGRKKEVTSKIDAALQQTMLAVDNKLNALYELIKCGLRKKKCTELVEKSDQLFDSTNSSDENEKGDRKSTKSKKPRRKNKRGKSRKTSVKSNQSKNREKPRGRGFNKQTNKDLDDDNEEENNADEDEEEDEDKEGNADENTENNEDDDDENDDN